MKPANEQLLNDLEWALTSPELLDFGSQLPALPNDILRDWKAWFYDRADSIDWLKTPGLATHTLTCKRLGIYFETLWWLLMQHYPQVELKAYNLQVHQQKPGRKRVDGTRANGTTLGAFDFVYFCKTRQQAIHRETAVKFYLGVGTPNTLDQWSTWIGPGVQDRLDLKANSLLHRQSRLAQTAEGREQLKVLGINEVQREVCLKGYLFYPLAGNAGQDAVSPAQSGSPQSNPQLSNPKHLRGQWLEVSDMTASLPSGDWWILPKPQWLSPACGELPAAQDSGANNDAVNAKMSLAQLCSAVCQSLQAIPFPVMAAHRPKVADREKIVASHHSNELQRYFIVPDGYYIKAPGS